MIEPYCLSLDKIELYLWSLSETDRVSSKYYWWIEKKSVENIDKKLIQTTNKDK